MDELSEFIRSVGFPGAVAVGALGVIYRVFSRLADGHLRALQTVEKTQVKLCETQEEMLRILKTMHESTARIGESVPAAVKEAIKNELRQ